MDAYTLERFLSKVEITETCWFWKSSKNNYGYGQFHFDGGPVLAHRLIYLHTFGELTEGLEVCHSCRNKCVNPEHLVEGTKAQNQGDRVRDGTSNRGEKSFKSKLTAEQVLQIRSRSTEKHTDLAKEFGVAIRSIGLIIHRKNWKHI